MAPDVLVWLVNEWGSVPRAAAGEDRAPYPDAGLLAGLLAGASAEDAAWLGLACGALVATGLGSDAGIEDLGQVLDFLARTQPAAAGRIRDRIKDRRSTSHE